MENSSDFTSIHLDAIREVGNIGTGNAATALSQLIGHCVDMDVPKAELVPIYDVAAHYGSPETPICAVLVRTEDEFSCSLIFMIEEVNANLLTDLIIPMDISGMSEDMQLQIRNSALSEQGNIILSAFMSALSQITGWTLPTTTPAVARDMLGAIMDLVASMFGVIGDSAMLVKTSLRIKDLDCDLSGNVVMIPDPGALDALLSKLGVL